MPVETRPILKQIITKNAAMQEYYRDKSVGPSVKHGEFVMPHKDQKSNTEKVAGLSKKVNIITAPIWLGVAGVGVATANPVLIGAGAVGAGVDTAQGVGSHIVEKRAKNNSLEKTQLAEAKNGETVVFEKGDKQWGRRIAGETLFWGGGIYGVYNLITLDLGGALVGGAAHIAGRWVRPKPEGH